MKRFALLPVLVLLAACSQDLTTPALTADLPLAADVRLSGNLVPLTICHATGGGAAAGFVSIVVDEEALGGHLSANGTPRAGHQEDYLVTDRTPCPPPASPGTLRVCKIGGPGLPNGTPFTFKLNDVQAVVVTGECIEREYRVGTRVLVQEQVPADVAVHRMTLLPAMAGTVDVDAASASVVVGADVATLTVTNRSTTLGELVVCKIAGLGVDVGESAIFTISGVPGSTDFPAGAAPAGTCYDPRTIAAGATTVTETLAPGVLATSMVVDGQVPVVDLATATAVLEVVAGERTTLRVTNARSGGLVVCKIGADPFVLGRSYPFGATFPNPNNPIRTFSLESGPSATPICTEPMLNAPAEAGVYESIVPGIYVDIAVSPASRLISEEPATRSVRVNLAANEITTVTYTNHAEIARDGWGWLVVCSVAGDAGTLGQSYPYGATFSNPASPVRTFRLVSGPPTAPVCTEPMLSPATSAGVYQSQVPETVVESIVSVGSTAVVNLAQRSATVTILDGVTTTVTFTSRIAP